MSSWLVALCEDVFRGSYKERAAPHPPLHRCPLRSGARANVFGLLAAEIEAEFLHHLHQPRLDALVG